MSTQRNLSGFLLLLVLAGVGALLVYLPPQVMAQYQAVSELGPTAVYFYFGLIGVGGVFLLVASVTILWRLWKRTLRKRERKQRRDKNPSQLTAKDIENEIDANLSAVGDLHADAAVPDELRRELEPLAQQVEAKRESQQLEITAFGTISSGKSSLLNALAGRDVFMTDAKGGTTVERNEIPWPGFDRVTLVDTPGLGEIDGVEHQAISASSAKDADIVLVVVDGPLRDSEFHLLQRLGEMEKRVVVCLNKEDWYSDQEQVSLIGQITDQVQEFVRAEDVVAVRSKPAKRLRVRILADGSESEERVDVGPDISPLASRMMRIVRRDGQDLLLANLLLQSRGMVQEARERVRASLDKRAWEIVNKYMWGAGGAAAVSPFPLVDLAAGCAISTKMVVDLAQVYRQEVDLDTAVRLLGEIGKQLLAILGISVATPVITTAIASLLKTVPGAGTIAGGLLQGIVMAVVTRWIGGVFIEYFKNEMQMPGGGLAELARREWEKVTSLNELRKLIASARKHWNE